MTLRSSSAEGKLFQVLLSEYSSFFHAPGRIQKVRHRVALDPYIPMGIVMKA